MCNLSNRGEWRFTMEVACCATHKVSLLWDANSCLWRHKCLACTLHQGTKTWLLLFSEPWPNYLYWRHFFGHSFSNSIVGVCEGSRWARRSFTTDSQGVSTASVLQALLPQFHSSIEDEDGVCTEWYIIQFIETYGVA